MKSSFLKKAQGFTLVELITVVTILAVLSAIGFVSFSGYLAGVRDTNRLSQLTSIYDGLELYTTKNDLPLPDDAIEIKNGSSLLWYQGNIGANILDILDFSRGGVDPKDDSYFVYYLSADKSDFQLMAFFEEEQNVPTVFFPQAYADKDYSNLYPVVFGEKLWILLDNANAPVHEIDAIKGLGELDLSGNTETYTAFFGSDDTLTDTWDNLLSSLIPDASCKRLYDLWNRKDGVYEISLDWTKSVEVYCDMNSDGWGWTLVVGIDGENSNHLNASEVTVENLTNINGKGKFSDDDINTLTRDYIKLTCDGYSDYFNARGQTFSSVVHNNSINSAYDTYNELPLSWDGYSQNSGNVWVTSYGHWTIWTNGLIYGNTQPLNGCRSLEWGWNDDGLLWVK